MGSRGEGLLEHASHRRGQNRWRIAAGLLALGKFAWGMAALVYVATRGAQAAGEAHFRDVETVFVVPQDGEWFNVKIVSSCSIAGMERSTRPSRLPARDAGALPWRD